MPFSLEPEAPCVLGVRLFFTPSPSQAQGRLREGTPVRRVRLAESIPTKEGLAVRKCTLSERHWDG